MIADRNDCKMIHNIAMQIKENGEFNDVLVTQSCLLPHGFVIHQAPLSMELSRQEY